eukprot:Skav225445  [mRNA]  locus=scaffold1668:238802:239440:- [translate_table: standard]
MIQRFRQIARSWFSAPQAEPESEAWELVTDPEVSATPEAPSASTTTFGSTGEAYRAANRVPQPYVDEIREGELFAAHRNPLLEGFTFEAFLALEADPAFATKEIARARLARALRAGLGAKYKLEGRSRTTCKSPYVPGKKNWYVVLRSRNYPEGFLTQDYTIYSREVQSAGAGRIGFDPSSVSHSFTTLAEVSAFLAGAQKGWPELELQEGD